MMVFPTGSTRFWEALWMVSKQHTLSPTKMDIIRGQGLSVASITMPGVDFLDSDSHMVKSGWHKHVMPLHFSFLDLLDGRQIMPEQ